MVDRRRAGDNGINAAGRYPETLEPVHRRASGVSRC